MCERLHGVMFNSRVATRSGHARRRSLNWSGCVCCHHCRGASDEPPSSPLQSPPPLKPPHQRRRARPGIEPGLHACVRRRRCLRWRRRSRRRRQQQQRRRGVYVECTYVGWLVARPAALAAALTPRGHRARPRGRPRERGASVARGRRATCRHEVNVCSFRIFSASSSRTRAGNFSAIFIGGVFGFRPGSTSVRVRVRVPEKTARARAPPTAMLDVPGLTTRSPALGRARAPARAEDARYSQPTNGLVSGATRTPAPPAAATARSQW